MMAAFSLRGNRQEAFMLEGEALAEIAARLGAPARSRISAAAGPRERGLYAYKGRPASPPKAPAPPPKQPPAPSPGAPKPVEPKPPEPRKDGA